MIRKENLEATLKAIGYIQSTRTNVFEKKYAQFDWAEHKIFGIEKDYRLARVSKISLFMHGAGDGNIIFGDGLENYTDKDISPCSFDILVANPPYSVKSFKPHLKLKDNTFTTLEKISNDGSEIETLFIERIAQLLKPTGIAAVILPILVGNSNTLQSTEGEVANSFRPHIVICAVIPTSTNKWDIEPGLLSLVINHVYSVAG